MEVLEEAADPAEAADAVAVAVDLESKRFRFAVAGVLEGGDGEARE